MKRRILLILSLSCALNGLNIVLFTTNNLRIHDNPCLNYVFGSLNLKSSTATPEIHEFNTILPVFFDCTGVRCVETTSAVADLDHQLIRMGGGLLKYRGEIRTCIGRLQEDADNLCNQQTSLRIVYKEPPLERDSNLLKRLCTEMNIETEAMTDSLVLQGKLYDKDLNFKKFSELYRNIQKPTMNYKLKFDPILHDLLNQQNKNVPPLVVEQSSSWTSNISESNGLRLIKEYVELGEDEFTRKYFEDYINFISQSEDHRLANLRLIEYRFRLTSCPPNHLIDSSKIVFPSEMKKNVKQIHFFQGEVISGLLSMYLQLGCISPKLLLHARSTLFNGLKSIPLQRPIFCRLKSEAIRKDWHHHLAENSLKSEQKVLTWNYSYRYWKGYIQRDAHFPPTSTSQNTNKPFLFLIHGFGGSVDQYTGLARQLRDTFQVYALDSLGFGHSEKPPLSYNQYLWRDQTVDFIHTIIEQSEEKYNDQNRAQVIIAGNSIGGFTAASVAAKLSEAPGDSTIECTGLILFNPSGKTYKSTQMNIPESPKYDPYQGVPSEALRVFGNVVFNGLQPNIRKTCEWLYPTNPQHVVASGLDVNIFRDSCDPGAPDVIAAGGKLPSPVSLNSLLLQYKGPVLLAQGVLDPLNNATARAAAIQPIRSLQEALPPIKVDLLSLGHCPMDEDSIMVANSIRVWFQECCMNATTIAELYQNQDVLI